MEPENWDLEDDFPFQTGHLRVPCYFPGRYASNLDVIMIKKADENLTSSQPWWPLPERQHHHLHKPVTSTEAVAVTCLTQDLDHTTVCHHKGGDQASRLVLSWLKLKDRERERERVWKEIQVQYMKYNGAWFLITGVVSKVKDQLNQQYTLNTKVLQHSF